MALTSAASFADYMEGEILAWFQGTAFATAPTTWYVGLFTTNPADTGTKASPANGTEMSTSNGSTGFSNYARVAITAASGWNAIAAATGDSTGQQITNNAVLPASGTAWTNNGGSTVTVTGIGLWDANTSGNLWIYIPLAVAQAITNGAAFSLPATTGIVFQVD